MPQTKFFINNIKEFKIISGITNIYLYHFFVRKTRYFNSWGTSIIQKGLIFISLLIIVPVIYILKNYRKGIYVDKIQII